MVPAVQARQVYSALRVDVFTLPYEHAGSGSQQADGRRERKGIQEPQQDGQVIRVPCQYTTIHTHMNQASSEQLPTTTVFQTHQRAME